jgi:hypothetical protein
MSHGRTFVSKPVQVGEKEYGLVGVFQRINPNDARADRGAYIAAGALLQDEIEIEIGLSAFFYCLLVLGKLDGIRGTNNAFPPGYRLKTFEFPPQMLELPSLYLFDSFCAGWLQDYSRDTRGFLFNEGADERPESPFRYAFPEIENIARVNESAKRIKQLEEQLSRAKESEKKHCDSARKYKEKLQQLHAEWKATARYGSQSRQQIASTTGTDELQLVSTEGNSSDVVRASRSRGSFPNRSLGHRGSYADGHATTRRSARAAYSSRHGFSSNLKWLFGWRSTGKLNKYLLILIVMLAVALGAGYIFRNGAPGQPRNDSESQSDARAHSQVEESVFNTPKGDASVSEEQTNRESSFTESKPAAKMHGESKEPVDIATKRRSLLKERDQDQ